MFIYTIVVIAVVVLSSVALAYTLRKNNIFTKNILYAIISSSAAVIVLCLSCPFLLGFLIYFPANINKSLTTSLGVTWAIIFTLIVFASAAFFLALLISSRLGRVIPAEQGIEVSSLESHYTLSGNGQAVTVEDPETAGVTAPDENEEEIEAVPESSEEESIGQEQVEQVEEVEEVEEVEDIDEAFERDLVADEEPVDEAQNLQEASEEELVSEYLEEVLAEAAIAADEADYLEPPPQIEADFEGEIEAEEESQSIPGVETMSVDYNSTEQEAAALEIEKGIAEIQTVDDYIDEAFKLKENGDFEGAILYYMYALDMGPENDLVFWIILDTCVLYKELGQTELARDILESYVNIYGNIMDTSVKVEIEKNLL